MIRRSRRAVLALMFSMTLAGGMALAHSSRVGSVEIGHAWALPSEGAERTQGFVPLLSVGGDDRLVAVTTSRARQVEIAGSERGGQQGLALRAGAPVGMRPGGRVFLVFVGLDRPWKAGERVPARLVFERAGATNVEFWVETSPYAGG